MCVGNGSNMQMMLENCSLKCCVLACSDNCSVFVLKKTSQFLTYCLSSVSHRVIEEVNNIQENLEIEKTCRESVEALASKLNRQNRSLKRKSMLYMSHLGADVIAEISLDDEGDEDLQEEESGVCSSSHCQIVIIELKDKLEVILAEKKQITIDLEATREQLCQTRQKLLKEKHDNTVLIAETFQQKKLLGKYNRGQLCSCSLQSYQSVSLSVSLSLYCFPVPTLIFLTAVLVKALEEQIELLEEERKEWQHKHTKAETEAKDLRFTVEELKKKLQQVSNPPPAAPGPPPPPPTPPPPPPLPAPSSNPLSSLLSILRKKKDVSTEIALVEKDSSEKTPEKDIRHQAVDEMMQRIKKGVQLRHVCQRSSRARPGPVHPWYSNGIFLFRNLELSVKCPGPSSLPGTRPPSPSPKSELEKARTDVGNTFFSQTQPEPGQNTRDQDTVTHDNHNIH
uniref:Shootin-1 n=1 Tax=Cyprinus carpio TaxID=7962 RepID=A0A8C1W1B2_CYPCA